MTDDSAATGEPGGRLSEALVLFRAESVGVVALLVGLAFVLGPFQVNTPASLSVLFEIGVLFLVYGLLVLGVNLHYGFTGLINFGHVAFFAVGAYAMGMLSARDPFAGIGLGLPWPVGLAGAVLAAAVLGAVLGLTTLRLRDDFLAIVTIATAEIVQDLVGSFEGITGADVGLLNIPRPIYDLAGGDGDSAVVATIVIFAGVLLLSYAVLRRLTNAPYGDVLRAIRDDELAARALGKPAFDYKFQVFVYGTALAGLAGGLWALYLGAISPGYFTIDVTITLYIAMYVGGIGTHRGALLGLVIIIGLRLVTRFLNEAAPITQSQFASARLFLIGFVLVLIIRYRPEGILGDRKELGID
jgi:branched-chain amino acid transport system permease protein